MVERPADVLQMDKTASSPVAWHARVDNALRKTPGLGIFIAGCLLSYFWQQSPILFAMLLLAVIAALIDEFSAKGSSPK
jgi:hypothetical protein